MGLKDPWTLDDYLWSLFKTNATESDEFQTMLRIYGRERIARSYREFKKSLSVNPFSRFHPYEKEEE